MTAQHTISPPLRALWKQRTVSLATNVAMGGREHREIAHASSLIRQDYHDRFLIELLQNANDQAILGGEDGSTVVVVRSQGLLAVSNGGQVMTQRNLERLSSLADSDKSGLLVGNKGVGFKAVYQISDRPEIYSAADRDHGHSVDDVFKDFGIGIVLAQAPFEDGVLLEAIEEDVREFFAENPGLARALLSKGIHDPYEAVRPELAHAAGFKFPLARSSHDLRTRIVELGVRFEEQHAVKTLVVLPLRDKRAAEDVERAVDRLVGYGNAALAHAEIAVLFLKGISTVTVIDQVRGMTWTYSGSTKQINDSVSTTTVSIKGAGLAEHAKTYWTMQRDVFAGAAAIVKERRRIVEAALREFDLEAWNVDDPIPVTIALPKPTGSQPGSLGPAGRFCLGVPTEQSTGLPVHVDARFFATISRTGLDFGLDYNSMLLDVASELFGDLLSYLRSADSLMEKRAATLALHRTPGALADRAFAPAGIANGDVVLGWGGESFRSRQICRMPDKDERGLLLSVGVELAGRSVLHDTLPEEGLLAHASEVLESLALAPLRATPHPWLMKGPQGLSLIEESAQAHRAEGPEYWEPFVASLLDVFDASELADQFWMPVGRDELAAPRLKVFLPARADASSEDDEEVSNVPARVAAVIRLLDEQAFRLRNDGRAHSPLASKLVEEGLVRPPRRTELLEEALFPALKEAAATDSTLALQLFAQAAAWIVTMRDISRGKLDCRQALAPVQAVAGAPYHWIPASTAYLGNGWGLPDDHSVLLENAYPARRLVSLAALREELGIEEAATEGWRAAVETMGVTAWPRVVEWPKRPAPLFSSNLRLFLGDTSFFEGTALDGVYRAYVQFLTQFGTKWSDWFQHDVEHAYWIDNLEFDQQRPAIVDLLLMQPNRYLPFCRDSFGRVGKHAKELVPSMWAFALSELDWAVFPGEQGVGYERRRVAASHLWRLPEGARVTGYARLLSVVPQDLSEATRLLSALGVPSLDDAPLGRLLRALDELGRRLDAECLNTRPEALSLANELYSQVESRLAQQQLAGMPPGYLLPVQRGRRLEAIDPTVEQAVLVFDDNPVRARHIPGLDTAVRVPVARETDVSSLYDVFVRTWGRERVVRTSTAKVELGFEPSSEGAESFLGWLQRTYPHDDIVAELAALLTFGGERLVRAEAVSRNWKSFERLQVSFGSFGDSETTGFYERSTDTLMVSTSLEPHEVVAMTWELAGQRSRDLLASYASALANARSREFLRDRGIGDVEIVDVADAAGLHRPVSTDDLAPALLAARCNNVVGTTLDEAAAWLGEVGNRPEDVAVALGRIDLTIVIEKALGLRSPEGEIEIIRHLSVPWELWQQAVLRQNGKRYLFNDSVKQYQDAKDHWTAVARELGVRDASTDLAALSKVMMDLLSAPVPDAVQYRPPDVVRAAEVAWRDVQAALDAFPAIVTSLGSVTPPPWSDELPIPVEATRRGARLFRDSPVSVREVEAVTSVRAIIEVATRLAATVGERVDGTMILLEPSLSSRMKGEWAHVYAALLMLRPLLEASAPETFKRLSSVLAFRDATTVAGLLAKLPEIPRSEFEPPKPKQPVLGVELTVDEIRADLASGSGGVLGAKIAAAATLALDQTVLSKSRIALPQPKGVGISGATGSGSVSGTGARQRREPELVGDIGEALVHEWLGVILGAEYGADCWQSKSRERYGLPACGDDSLGYDFKVADPCGKLFGKSAKALLIEVKSTSTDGRGPFPMSRAEWDRARQCHEMGNDPLYVIVRVFAADSAPRIGDVVIDPFDAHRRGEIRLADRDLWVTVAPRRLDG